VADALAAGGLELEQRDLRRGFAAPALPRDCLDDLADALHRFCASCTTSSIGRVDAVIVAQSSK
jgi:hypothetical protein